jgi:hypothetical protein
MALAGRFGNTEPTRDRVRGLVPWCQDRAERDREAIRVSCVVCGLGRGLSQPRETS